MDTQQVQPAQIPSSTPSLPYDGKPQLKWALIIILIAILSSSATYVVLTTQSKPQSPSYPTTTPVISPQQSNQPTETVTPQGNSSANLKVYSKNNISFQYPSSWTEKPMQLLGSGFTQEISDPNGSYTLTITMRGNYNNGTGKPFVSLNEYVGISYKLPAKIVAGQEGIQVLPRTGSENKNAVDFFSKDNKFIYMLELATNSADEAKIQDGQKLFDQILSTFKFTE